MSRNPYLDVLRVPGAAAFSASGGLARLPNAMVAIGTVLMVQEYTGSFAAAGRVSAVLVVAQALGAPQVARFVDRRGQRRVLRPLVLVTTAGLLGMVVAATTGAPEWVLWLFAVVAGASQGSYGSYVRARWTHAVSDPRHLHTAFSFEGAVDEMVFVVGPVLATFLATAVIPSGGLLVAALVGMAGALVFLAQRGTEPATRAVGAARPSSDDQVLARADDGALVAVEGPGRSAGRSALLIPGMPALALVFVAMGTIFGAADVSTVAFATEQGARELSGLLLATFAGGSLVSGLVYGAVHWRSRLSTRFLLGTVALAAGVSLFLAAHSKPVLAVAMFATGFAIAPTIINGNAMVQALVPPAQLTEGLSWIGTAIGAGTALGAWLGGARVDVAGSGAGYLVAMVAGWACVLLALAALPTLRSK